MPVSLPIDTDRDRILSDAPKNPRLAIVTGRGTKS
jgi:hypothetical protein